MTDAVAAGQQTAAEKGEQLRSKIDEARGRLQDQVAKSASAAKDKIADTTPAVHAAVDKAADATKSGVEAAPARLRTRSTSSPRRPQSLTDAAADAADAAPTPARRHVPSPGGLGARSARGTLRTGFPARRGAGSFAERKHVHSLREVDRLTVYGEKHKKTGVRKRVGRLVDVLFHPSEPRVVGFTVERPDLLLMIRRADRYVALDRAEILDDRVVVDGTDAWGSAGRQAARASSGSGPSSGSACRFAPSRARRSAQVRDAHFDEAGRAPRFDSG